MFKKILSAPLDPVLGIQNIYNEDKRSNKINLGIGVYVNEMNNIPILLSVKKAEHILLKQEKTKNYLEISGLKEFNILVQSLLLGENNTFIKDRRICTLQSPGGTGALKIAAEFLIKNTDINRVWISNPTWPNHYNVFNSSGFEVKHYNYYNHDTKKIDFLKTMENLNEATNRDVVVLHGCCHNPTGCDFNNLQWEQLSLLSKNNGWLPLFDLAYQGLGDGLYNDVKGLCVFSNIVNELIVCNSFSKNFGLYNERVGACTVLTENSKVADIVFSQLKYVARAIYSSPPSHGASILVIIMNDKTLKSIWEKELLEMRTRINNIRELFINNLYNQCSSYDWSFLKEQKGMFVYLGFNEKQVLKLRNKYGIYTVGLGRINITGMNNFNIDYICKNIVKVIDDK